MICTYTWWIVLVEGLVAAFGMVGKGAWKSRDTARSFLYYASWRAYPHHQKVVCWTNFNTCQKASFPLAYPSRPYPYVNLDSAHGICRDKYICFSPEDHAPLLTNVPGSHQSILFLNTRRQKLGIIKVLFNELIHGTIKFSFKKNKKEV